MSHKSITSFSIVNYQAKNIQPMNILRIPVGFILKIVGINIFKENIEDSCLGPIKKIYIKKPNQIINVTINEFCIFPRVFKFLI